MKEHKAISLFQHALPQDRLGERMASLEAFQQKMKEFGNRNRSGNNSFNRCGPNNPTFQKKPTKALLTPSEIKNDWASLCMTSRP